MLIHTESSGCTLAVALQLWWNGGTTFAPCHLSSSLALEFRKLQNSKLTPPPIWIPPQLKFWSQRQPLLDRMRKSLILASIFSVESKKLNDEIEPSPHEFLRRNRRGNRWYNPVEEIFEGNLEQECIEGMNGFCSSFQLKFRVV